MTITDDDVKTRAQKEKLEEISADAPPNVDKGEVEGGADEENNSEQDAPPPKIPRDNTMEVTAKVLQASNHSSQCSCARFDCGLVFNVWPNLYKTGGCLW